MQTMDRQQKIVDRLTRKVAILEEMLEKSSRDSFVEAQQRNSLNALLHLSLLELPLADILGSSIDILLAQDFLNIENKGCIFLVNKEADLLELSTHRNFSQELVAKCQGLPLDHCLCGKSPQGEYYANAGSYICSNGEISGGDTNSDMYCAPLKSGDFLLGVLCLTLPAKMPLSSEQLEFLDAGADILSGTIQKIIYREEIAAFNRSKKEEVDAALALEKERLMVTLRSIGEGVIATDVDGLVVLMNKAAEKLTGWDNQEALQHELREILPVTNEESGKPYHDQVATVLQKGSLLGLDRHAVLTTRDGRKRRVDVSGAPIRDWQSQTIGVVLVCRDVTNEQKMEVELLKKRQLQSLGVLAGGIAHDFNNILTAILGNIFLAGRLVDQGSNAFLLLKEAEKASQRAAALVQQLLTFSKGGEPVKKAARMTEILTTTTDFVLRGSNIACEYQIADNLWLADVDSGQMSQVVQNLIINAKHAMPDGGKIIISGKNIVKNESDSVPLPRGSYLEIRISDQGIGIPEEKLANIFDPYFTTKEKGSGLGLAITHSIMIKHAGSIRVESKVGEGTIFTLYLPAMPGKGLAVAREVSRDTTGQGRVLVMDDDEMVRETTGAMLNSIGYQAVLVSDGLEAIKQYTEALVGSNPFDAVIMDLTIPGGMGGRDAISIILRHDPGVKALVSSGYANDPILANPSKYGFKGALVKPFHINDLSGALNKLVSQNH